MILFARESRLGFWLERQVAARELGCDPLERWALREALERLSPGGNTTLLLERVKDAKRASKSIQEFALWAEARSVRPRIVLVGSSEVYSVQRPGLAAREEDAAACDELAIEQELAAAARRRGLALVVARLFEVIDPQAPDALLVELAARIRKGRMRGAPLLGTTRDYLDAEDAAQALCALASLEGSATVNVCSGSPTSGGELLRRMVRRLRPGDEQELMAQAEPDEQPRVPWLVGSPARFIKLTERTAAQRTLDQTIEEACEAL